MFILSAVLFLNVTNSSLTNAVSGNVFDTFGSITTTNGIFGTALQLTGDTYYDVDALSSITNQFTFSFRLTSTNPGMVTNPNDNSTQPLQMALFNKSTLSYSSGTGQTVATNDMFSMWEETQSDGTNVMKIQVNGATSATRTSLPYTVGVSHHFWIEYGSSSLNVYIDGAIANGSLSGTVPSSLTGSVARFGINKGLASFGYQMSRNFGILEDLFISSQADSSVTDIFRALDLGAIYVADSTKVTQDEVSFGSTFDDTSTIQVNAIYGNRGNVYVGRSDGTLTKGNRTIWESRRDFANADEINYMTIITRSTTDNYVVQQGALTVTNAIIRV